MLDAENPQKTTAWSNDYCLVDRSSIDKQQTKLNYITHH